MKPNNGFRGKGSDSDTDDVLKKAAKLSPVKKSGKERHMLYSSLEEDDDPEFEDYRKKESILDYFDDQEEDSEFD